MNRFFGKVAKAAMIAAVMCLIASGALAKDPQRPYISRTEGTTSLAMPGDPCEGGYFFAASGNATHLGLAEEAGCVFFVGCDDPPDCTVLLTAGYGATTAANGDQLYTTLTGTYDISGDPQIGHTLVSVDGGTGRFANAVGQLDCLTLAPAPGLEYTNTCVGTIAY